MKFIIIQTHSNSSKIEKFKAFEKFDVLSLKILEKFKNSVV